MNLRRALISSLQTGFHSQYAGEVFETSQRLRVPCSLLSRSGIIRQRTNSCQGIAMALHEGTQAGSAIAGRHALDLFEARDPCISHGQNLYGISS